MNRLLKMGLIAVLGLVTATSTLSACATPPPAYLPTGSGDAVPSLAPMLERVTPAVVNIFTEGRATVRPNPLLEDPLFRRFFGIPDQPRERHTQSLGSGVVVDARRGYVVTNHHVVEGADVINVTLRDGRRLRARVIGSDRETDVALIQVPAEKLIELPLANSDAVRVGDFVVAIGNPFGIGQTVTSGIVSALGRSQLGIQGYENFIQTDASINPGNSGGALVNLRGELIGVNTAILAPTGVNVGIGFAIPSNMVRQLLEQLLRFGEVRRGRLGVSVQDLNPELAQAFGMQLNQGAVITQVQPGSAAQRAGLQPGDVVVAIDDKPIQGSNELRNAIGLLPIGREVKLDVLREGRELSLNATVSPVAVASVAGKELNPRLAGAVFKDLTAARQQQVEGVLVEQVTPGSPAERGGLRRNDVITGVNRQAIADTSALQQLATSSRSLLLNVQRGDQELLILLR